MSDHLVAIKDLCVRGKGGELLAAVKAAMAERSEAKARMTEFKTAIWSYLAVHVCDGEPVCGILLGADRFMAHRSC